MKKPGEDHPSSKNCRWGGGNDYHSCRDCFAEYDYRREWRPPCEAKERRRKLLEQKHNIENMLLELEGKGE